MEGQQPGSQQPGSQQPKHNWKKKPPKPGKDPVPANPMPAISGPSHADQAAASAGGDSSHPPGQAPVQLERAASASLPGTATADPRTATACAGPGNPPGEAPVQPQTGAGSVGSMQGQQQHSNPVHPGSMGYPVGPPGGGPMQGQHSHEQPPVMMQQQQQQQAHYSMHQHGMMPPPNQTMPGMSGPHHQGPAQGTPGSFGHPPQQHATQPMGMPGPYNMQMHGAAGMPVQTQMPHQVYHSNYSTPAHTPNAMPSNYAMNPAMYQQPQYHYTPVPQPHPIPMQHSAPTSATTTPGLTPTPVSDMPPQQAAAAHPAASLSRHPLRMSAQQVPSEQATLPSSTLTSLAFVPGQLCPLQPGEKRLCGFTLHPSLVPYYDECVAKWTSDLEGKPEEERDDIEGDVSEQIKWNLAHKSECKQVWGTLKNFRKQCEGLMGVEGMSQLPEVVELRGVRPVAVDRDLGRGLVAAQALKKGFVLGPLSGYLMPGGLSEGDLVQQQLSSSLSEAQVQQLRPGGASAQDVQEDWKFDATRYCFTVKLTPPDLPAATAGDGLECQLTVWGLGYGNMGMLINDAVAQPGKWLRGAQQTLLGNGYNVQVVMLDLRGMPFPFLVTKQDIAPGEALSVEYGMDWWKAHNRKQADVWDWYGSMNKRENVDKDLPLHADPELAGSGVVPPAPEAVPQSNAPSASPFAVPAAADVAGVSVEAVSSVRGSESGGLAAGPFTSITGSTGAAAAAGGDNSGLAGAAGSGVLMPGQALSAPDAAGIAAALILERSMEKRKRELNERKKELANAGGIQPSGRSLDEARKAELLAQYAGVKTESGGGAAPGEVAPAATDNSRGQAQADVGHRSSSSRDRDRAKEHPGDRGDKSSGAGVSRHSSDSGNRQRADDKPGGKPREPDRSRGRDRSRERDRSRGRDRSRERSRERPRGQPADDRRARDRDSRDADRTAATTKRTDGRDARSDHDRPPRKQSPTGQAKSSRPEEDKRAAAGSTKPSGTDEARAHRQPTAVVQPPPGATCHVGSVSAVLPPDDLVQRSIAAFEARMQQDRAAGVAQPELLFPCLRDGSWKELSKQRWFDADMQAVNELNNIVIKALDAR